MVHFVLIFVFILLIFTVYSSNHDPEVSLSKAGSKNLSNSYCKRLSFWGWIAIEVSYKQYTLEK